jgi:hypothetical protein
MLGALRKPEIEYDERQKKKQGIIRAHHRKIGARTAAARRRGIKLKARPNWADEAAIKRVFAEAKRMTEVTGVQYVVDHIVPLQHPDVCGLDIAENMRAIPFGQNAAKSNWFDPDAEERSLLRHARKYGI